MSSINNVITTTFRAVGGNVVSQLGSYAAGFGRLGQQIYGATNQSSRLNQQWKAFGTTIRYAIAGSTLYGLGNMVRQLSAVNQQLGEMQALTDVGGGRFSDSQMGTLFYGLQDASVSAITPLQDVNDAAINLLSTVQGVKSSDMPSMLTDIGRAAKIAQTPIEDLTQAAAVAQVQFKRPANRQTFHQFTQMWQQLIAEAPGAAKAGPQIAQATPQLAAMFTAAGGGGVAPNVQQAQMLSLILGVLRTGTPPATGLRGLQYFIQSIAFAKPGTKPAAALAAIGVTPQFIDQHGIYAAVMKVLTQIGGQTNISAAGAAQLAGIPEESNAFPGVSASERARLAQMIPRIHGQRAAVVLASQLQRHGQIESLAEDLNNMIQVQNDQSAQAHHVAQMWKDFEKRSRLAEAATAIQNMGIQVATMFNPVFDFVAKAPIGAFHLMNKHHGVATIAGRTMVGLLAGGMAARFFGLGDLPGIRRIPGMSRIFGRGAGMGMVPQGLAAMAAMSGNPGILGATPQNPMYVSVINDLFGGGTPGPGPTPPGGGGFPKVFGWFKGAGKWIGRGAARGAGLLEEAPGAVVTAAGAAAVILDLSNAAKKASAMKKVHWSPHGQPYLNIEGNLSPFAPKQQHEVILQRAQEIFGRNVRDFSHYNVGKFHGQVDFNLQIDQRDANGKLTRRTVHVPVDIWSGGNHPRNRGQSGKNGRR